MDKTFHNLSLLLCKIDEENLIESLPVISENTAYLLEKIKSSPNLEAANSYFDLLYVFTAPLACLDFKYHHELNSELIEILQNERIDDPIFRSQVFEKVQRGEAFKWVK